MAKIILSVLRSGDGKEMFQNFEDFDEYAYDAYTDKLFNSDASGDFVDNDIEYEILGGYIIKCLGYNVPDFKNPMRIENPSLKNIIGSTSCHLIGKTKVNLYSGDIAGRRSYHILFSDEDMVESFAVTLKYYYEKVKDEHIEGTLRDINTCLKFFGLDFI